MTFVNVFDVLPFGNRLVVRTVTGATLVKMLEAGVFQVSRGNSYAYDATGSRAQKVDPSTLTIGGRAVHPAARIRVASLDFIWGGGDGVVVAIEEPIDAGADIDLFLAYLARHSPVPPGPQDRIIRRP